MCGCSLSRRIEFAARSVVSVSKIAVSNVEAGMLTRFELGFVEAFGEAFRSRLDGAVVAAFRFDDDNCLNSSVVFLSVTDADAFDLHQNFFPPSAILASGLWSSRVRL